MIKLFSVKDKQKKDAAAAAAGKPKQSAGELRLQKGANRGTGKGPAPPDRAARGASLRRCARCARCALHKRVPVPKSADSCRSRTRYTDLTELTLPRNISIAFPEGKEKPMHFEITIRPDEGMYKCGARRRAARPLGAPLWQRGGSHPGCVRAALPGEEGSGRQECR